MIGVRILIVAKVSPAPSMNTAPSIGAWLAEEIWFIGRPFRNQFPQGYGRRRSLRPASQTGITGVRKTRYPVLSHPDCNRRLRNRTESADPRGRTRGARGLQAFGLL